MTENIKLGKRKALKLLGKAVKSQGADFVYHDHFNISLSDTTGCRYVMDDAPACIVAHVLYRAGVPVERLKELDPGGSIQKTVCGPNLKNGGVAAAQELMYPLLGVQASPGAIKVLEIAQMFQDTGEPWGGVLEKVEDRLDEDYL